MEDDTEHHMAVVKDVVNKFKVSLKGKPRLWFEMQYPTSADEPKTKEAYEKMIASFITEHNTIGSTREQQIMAWKTLNWDPVQERLDDFVYAKFFLPKLCNQIMQSSFSLNDCAKNFLPVSLLLGYSVAACIRCPKCALVLGNGSERFCASRPLLGSYVHQESMLNKM